MMEVIAYPDKSAWENLCQRPTAFSQTRTDQTVKAILSRVKREGDRAVLACTRQFDGTRLPSLQVSRAEIARARKQVSRKLKDAINRAAANIELFHARSEYVPHPVHTVPGVTCWRRQVAIEKTGLYIPGGTAPLVSTVLMLGIPARLAGCREVVLCSPPDSRGRIAPAILYAANMLGISRIYKAGGAQAIAAMAYGTETIPRVYKIFGPGNSFVTRAKELVQLEGVAIDMPAGPSEVLIIADQTAIPDFVAADLLSQAEHGPGSQVILLSDNSKTLDNIIKSLFRQLQQLPRQSVTGMALRHSKAMLFENLTECLEFSNRYAPEHLIIATANADHLAGSVVNAGSVFLGNYSCESAGDYASGTNHTLPTSGYARSYSGLSVESFMKTITFQRITAAGLAQLAPTIEALADAEQLQGHKNAVTIRLNSLPND